jgi:hypothetical protein
MTPLSETNGGRAPVLAPRRNRRLQVLGAALLALMGSGGCALETEDAAEVGDFREAVPEAASVALAGPDRGTGAAAREQPHRSLTSFARTEPGEDSAPGAQRAWSYSFTRSLRDGVNQITRDVLGTVWLITHMRPSSVSADEATWGPHADALEPVAWRLRVVRVGEGTYDYFLEGRPKQTRGAFQVVLSGRGYDRSREEHGDGRFTINLDTWQSLDPAAELEDTGTLSVRHDLPRTITTDPSEGERRITAERKPKEAVGEWTITNVLHEDGSGALRLDAEADLDEEDAAPGERTALESLALVSQWNVTGAGRADYVLSGGDLPPEHPEITVVECWSPAYERAYYSDSAAFAPTEGSAEACAFDRAATITAVE